MPQPKPCIVQGTDSLIDACRHGDRQALEVVLRKHAPTVERLIARLVGPDAELEDLLQQTLIATVHAFPRFRGDASVKTWMSRIAVNVVRQHLRRPHRRRQVALELVPEQPCETDAGPEGNTGNRRALDRLFHHLDCIDANKRMAFVLHVFEGHPIDDVAAMVGASSSATKSRIFWCRKQLLARARRDPLLCAYVREEA